MYTAKITNDRLKTERKLERKNDRQLRKNISKGGIFQRMMTHRVDEIKETVLDERSHLEDLMENLESYEENLLNMPDVNNFNAYRDQVKKIVKKILDDGFLYKSFKDRHQRRYEFVKIIDNKLNELLTNITRRNKEIVVMLHLMGQIKGLILDVSA